MVNPKCDHAWNHSHKTLVAMPKITP